MKKEETTPNVDVEEVIVVEDEVKVVEEEVKEEIIEEVKVETDAVSEAMELNKKLKEELEELKNSTSNVFEDNAILKQELEAQKKLAAMAVENSEIKEQLEQIKRSTIIDSLIATGKINGDLKEWASELSLTQLEKFNKNAPKMKSILDETNKNADASSNELMEEWRKKQMKSRIL